MLLLLFALFWFCFVFFNETSSRHLCSKPCKVQSSPSAGVGGFVVQTDQASSAACKYVCSSSSAGRCSAAAAAALTPTPAPFSPSSRHTRAGARSASEVSASLGSHHQAGTAERRAPHPPPLSVSPGAAFGKRLSGLKPRGSPPSWSQSWVRGTSLCILPRVLLPGRLSTASPVQAPSLGPSSPPARRSSAPGCGRRSWCRGAGSWGGPGVVDAPGF